MTETRQTGRCGELFVQYKLLRAGIESALLTTDVGIDLVAYLGSQRKPITIQVKTRRRGRDAWSEWVNWDVSNECPAEYIAVVDADREMAWLFSMDEFRTNSYKAGGNRRLLWYTSESASQPSKTRSGRKSRSENDYADHEISRVLVKLTPSSPLPVK